MSALGKSGSTRRWRRIRLWVLNRDGWLCQAPGTVPAATGSWASQYAPAGWPRVDGRPGICGAYADHADHHLPRDAGGTDDVSNLKAMCPDHNLSKGAKLDPTTTTSRRPPVGRWEWS